MKKLLILTEAGDGIGFGHLTRCQAIASAAVSYDAQVFFWLYYKGENAPEIKLNNGSSTRCFNWLEEKEELKNLSKDTIVLIDSYLATRGHIEFIKSYFHTVFAIDDYSRIIYSVDCVINPNVFFEVAKYEKERAVGGKNYVILRKGFREAQSIAPRKVVRHILLTLGGSDFRNLLAPLTNLLANTGYEITVIDPSQNLPKEYQVRYKNLKHLGRLSAEGMLAGYLKADIVISACGQTLHELAALGKACIGIGLDIDQVPNQNYYLTAGFLGEALHWDSPNLHEEIMQALTHLLPLAERQKRFALGPTLVNRKGVYNVVKTLLP